MYAKLRLSEVPVSYLNDVILKRGKELVKTVLVTLPGKVLF